MLSPGNLGATVTRKEVGYTVALHGNGVSRLLRAALGDLVG